MSSKREYLACRQMTRAEFRATRGCTWPVKQNSPGFTIRYPNGTGFRIREEGPESYFYVRGICQKEKYEILEGNNRGAYETANEAAVAARPQVSSKAMNAYLYVEFQLDDKWVLANDLRYYEEIGMPFNEVEEIVMEEWRKYASKQIRKENEIPSRERIEARAEKLMDAYPEQWVDYAQNRIEITSSISLDLDLACSH